MFGEFGVIRLVVIAAVLVVILTVLAPRHRQRHACPPPLPQRKRCSGWRGWGWFWVLGIVAMVFFVRAKHRQEQAERLHIALSEMRSAADAHHLHAAERAPVLEVRLLLEKCDDHEVRSENLAAGILTLIDDLHSDTDEARVAARPDLKELGKTVVQADEDRIELHHVARLSYRKPLGGDDSPVSTVRILTDARPHSSLAQYSLDRLAGELRGVMDTRRENGEPSATVEFYGTGSPQNSTLDRRPEIVIRLAPNTDGTGDVPIAAFEPQLPGLPKPPQPPPSADPPTWPPQAGAPAEGIESLVDSALAWALGADERSELKRAIRDAKRDVAREAAKAIADVKAARTQAPQDAATAKNDARPSEAAADATVSVPGNEGGAPTWVTSPPEAAFDERGVFTLTGSTGALYSTPQESREALGEVLTEMIQTYAGQIIAPEVARQLDLSYLRSRAVTWTGSTVSDPMGLKYYETHAKLELGPDDHAHLLRVAQHQQAERRAQVAGVAGGAVLLLLATVLGFLKLDTATRGYYSGRLTLAAGMLAITVIAVAGMLLAFFGSWSALRVH
jgi:hypothetical protein